MPKSQKRTPLLAAAAAAAVTAVVASRAHGLVIYDGFAYPAGTLAEVTPTPAGNDYTGRTNPFGPTWHVAGSSTTDNITVTSPGLSGPAWLGGTGNSAEWAGPALDGNAARIEIGPFAGPGVGGIQQTVYYSLALNVTDV